MKPLSEDLQDIISMTNGIPCSDQRVACSWRNARCRGGRSLQDAGFSSEARDFNPQPYDLWFFNPKPFMVWGVVGGIDNVRALEATAARGMSCL